MNRHGLQREGKDLEHRWKKRIEVSLDVVVRGRDDLTLHGRTRDISMDGMFIRLAPDVVPTSTMVEIEVPHCGRLHGKVMHAGVEGIGVMFRLLGSNEKRHFVQLLAGKSAT